MMTFNLSQHQRRSPGKWNDPELPITGWHCVDIYESDDGRICQMCEWQEIHLIHVMWHLQYEGELHVGCDCAGRMEGNPANAIQRERNYKNIQRRRQNWPNRCWGKTEKGNLKLNVDGFRIVLVRKRMGWHIWLYDKHTQRSGLWKPSFISIEAAKLAAFDVMLQIKRRWRVRGEE